jgi:hypothetical protein
MSEKKARKKKSEFEQAQDKIAEVLDAVLEKTEKFDLESDVVIATLLRVATEDPERIKGVAETILEDLNDHMMEANDKLSKYSNFLRNLDPDIAKLMDQIRPDIEKYHNEQKELYLKRQEGTLMELKELSPLAKILSEKELFDSLYGPAHGYNQTSFWLPDFEEQKLTTRFVTYQMDKVKYSSG